MNTLFRTVTAFAVGAAAMYYLDPIAGRRRRALVRDQGVAAGHDVERYARAKAQRAADRVQGATAKARARLANAPVDDEQLHERIRARLRHVVERPADVEVQVLDGHVVLSGSAASADEIEALTATVAAMRGVDDLDVRLDEAGDEARH